MESQREREFYFKELLPHDCGDSSPKSAGQANKLGIQGRVADISQGNGNRISFLFFFL